MKQLLVVIIITINIFCGNSQTSGLVKDKDFFYSQISFYNEWLDSLDINKIITVNKENPLFVQSEKLTLILRAPSLRSWEYADSIFGKQFNVSLGTILFDNFTFLMDIMEDRSQAEIKILAPDANIVVFAKGDGVDISIEKTMGFIEAEPTVISIDKITGMPMSSLHLDDSLDIVKQKIKIGLREFFEEDKAYWSTLVYKDYEPSSSELILEVSNVRNTILHKGYFEHILISFSLIFKQKNLIINFKTYGKYGSGVFWAPRNSDYYPMDPKYLIDLETFNNTIIKSELNKILKK